MGNEKNYICNESWLFDKALDGLTLFVLTIIFNNCNKFSECYLSNKEISALLKRSERSIQRSLSKLEKLDYIKREQLQDNFLNRKIIITEKCHK